MTNGAMLGLLLAAATVPSVAASDSAPCEITCYKNETRLQTCGTTGCTRELCCAISESPRPSGIPVFPYILIVVPVACILIICIIYVVCGLQHSAEEEQENRPSEPFDEEAPAPPKDDEHENTEEHEETASSGTRDGNTVEEGEEKPCPVCLDPLPQNLLTSKRAVILAPCGHVVCSKCQTHTPKRGKCPVCRKVIESKVRVVYH